MYYNGNPVMVMGNISASPADSVLYTEQTLTEKQKEQARENIRAAEKPHKNVAVRQEFRHEINVDVGPGYSSSEAFHPQQTWMENPDAFAFDMTVTIGDNAYYSTQSDFTITETSAEEGTGLKFTPIDDPDIVAISFIVRHSSDRTNISFPSYSTNASVCLQIYENILEDVDLNIATSVNGVEADANGNVALDAVLYAEQSLTEDQKAQARENIDASKIPTGIVIEHGELLCMVNETNLTEKNGMFVYEYGATPDWMAEKDYFYILGTVYIGEKEEFLSFGPSDLNILSLNEYGVYQYSLDNCYDEDGEPLVVLSYGIGIDPVTGESNGGKLVFASKTKKVSIRVYEPVRKFTEVNQVTTVNGTHADLHGNISVPKYCVLYGSRQGLVSSQKEVARENINAASNDSVVKIDEEQSLTDVQKAQARENIGAADASAVVLHTQQALTEEQKEQARENIGAATCAQGAILLDEQRNRPNGGKYVLNILDGGLRLNGYNEENGNFTSPTKKILTNADMPGIIEDVIAALPIYNGEVEEV